MDEFIQCDSCLKSFERMDIGMGAGGCAAVIKDGIISGSYGSIYDMNVFQFIKQPESIKDGNICDDCITKEKNGTNLICVYEPEF